ncbi:sel1 repeat family protein, partial [Vibrio parahaemolyticus V-223/04]
STRSFVR